MYAFGASFDELSIQGISNLNDVRKGRFVNDSFNFEWKFLEQIFDYLTNF